MGSVDLYNLLYDEAKRHGCKLLVERTEYGTSVQLRVKISCPAFDEPLRITPSPFERPIADQARAFMLAQAAGHWSWPSA